MLTYPSGLFTRDYISVSTGCCPLNFSHAPQPPKLYFQSDLGCQVASSWAFFVVKDVELKCSGKTEWRWPDCLRSSVGHREI